MISYNNYIVEKVLTDEKAEKILEKNIFSSYKDIQHMVLKEYGSQLYFVATFNSAIVSLYPVMKQIIYNSNFDITLSTYQIVLLTIFAIAEILHVNNDAVKNIRKKLEEDGISHLITGVRRSLLSVQKIFNVVTKTVGKIDLVDLSVEDETPIVQPCKACISTAGGAHCHFPCDCYFKGDKDHPDFMSEFNIYKRLLKADAFILFSPINWWNVPTQVKAMFDRLVCGSLTITADQAQELWPDDVKNPVKTKKFSKTEEFKKMVKNHYEGKVGAFYIHGDDGADDYKNRIVPNSYTKYEVGKFDEPKYAILPIVWQCRYSGIDVPEELIEAFYMNEDISYSEANDKLKDGKLGFAIKKAHKLILDTYEYI